jgi:hypothetical protein
MLAIIALRRLRQEVRDFQASLGYSEIKQEKKNTVVFCLIVILS